MNVFTNVNKAYVSVQGTCDEAFAVVTLAVNDAPLINGWKAVMYYCIVAYHPEKGNYRRIGGSITQIHV